VAGPRAGTQKSTSVWLLTGLTRVLTGTDVIIINVLSGFSPTMYITTVELYLISGMLIPQNEHHEHHLPDMCAL
jgi:hypothetical protein